MTLEAPFQADVDAVRRIPAVAAILKVVCEATGMGFAAVARVTDDRWIACEVLDRVSFGLGPGEELPVETTLCHEVRGRCEEIVIDNVADDPVYASHHTPRIYGLQSYISVPITLPDGRFFGTLCAIDPKPAQLKNPRIVGMFRLFAELIAHHLANDQRLADSRLELVEERATAALREQFIAVLGHDLRSPLASVEAGTNLLLQAPLDDRSRSILDLMQNSLRRMNKLIGNVLDFARGRLSDGLTIELASDDDVVAVINQVVDEHRSTHADRQIVVAFGPIGRMSYDRVRIGQLVSNLLSNALTHGGDSAVTMVAGVTDEHFDLAVTNGGDPIPEALLPYLFEPFVRSRARSGAGGLGLGLYIAKQIAVAHGGSLTVQSSATETGFSFRMPVDAGRSSTLAGIGSRTGDRPAPDNPG